MSAPLPAPVAIATGEHDQYVVSHGKSGVIGVFNLAEPAPLPRGARVIVQTSRGIETGVVLAPATLRQARIFGAGATGVLLRRVDSSDDARRAEIAALEEQIFAAARELAASEGIAIEVIDVDLFFDGQNAIVQFVGAEAGTEHLAQFLEQQFTLNVRLENLAAPAAHDDDAEHRCDKPDCGKESGGCTSCSTGGGCSSCGSGKVDMREYFGHLRTKMENRIPLVP